jgi:hypothetical protein
MQHCYIHPSVDYARICDGGSCQSTDAGPCGANGPCVFWGGNAVKTRAQRNEIYYNWIEGSQYPELSLIGPDWSEVDGGGYPDGGSVPPNCTLQNSRDSLVREDSDVVGSP